MNDAPEPVDAVQRVIGSALWAAAGDALGWITELADAGTVRHRLDGPGMPLSPVAWRRRIGGRFGATLPMPAGTYSDDTQLRLATSRATRGNGEFDVEAFAKIELPVWTAYSLGAGRGTSAAAANLSKSSVAWFANFYAGRGTPNYFESGGNGAAMRIQPHVWKAKPNRKAAILRDVMRDAIVTHGHPHGFCGAAFHALCLEHALSKGMVPDRNDWREFLQDMDALPQVVARDEQLRVFWLPAWEAARRTTLQNAISAEVEGALATLDKIEASFSAGGDAEYEAVLNVFGARQPDRRGAGLGTAIIAAILAWLHRATSNSAALGEAASALGTDTDTIATMTGALLGAARPEPMTWPLQDREYITEEATRLAKLASGSSGPSFSYPDLMGWEPPGNQIDAVAELSGTLVLKGLGSAKAVTESQRSGEQVWQWLRLSFGQTVLTKRRVKPREANLNDIPAERVPSADEGSLFARLPRPTTAREDSARRSVPRAANPAPPLSSPKDAHASRFLVVNETLDELTDRVIRSDFDSRIIGDALIYLAQTDGGVERCVAFSAIIAKAVSARQRRGRPTGPDPTDRAK